MAMARRQGRWPFGRVRRTVTQRRLQPTPPTPDPRHRNKTHEQDLKSRVEVGHRELPFQPLLGESESPLPAQTTAVSGHSRRLAGVQKVVRPPIGRTYRRTWTAMDGAWVFAFGPPKSITLSLDPVVATKA